MTTIWWRGTNTFKFCHDDVIRWKHFPRYCAGNSPVPGEFPAQRPVTRSFDVFFDRITGWVNNGEAGDLRRHRAHYDVIVMCFACAHGAVVSQCYLNSLAPERFEWNFRWVICKLISIQWMKSRVSHVKLSSEGCHLTLITDDRSTLLQVMPWCRQATAITWVNVDAVLCRHIA